MSSSHNDTRNHKHCFLSFILNPTSTTTTITTTIPALPPSPGNGTQPVPSLPCPPPFILPSPPMTPPPFARRTVSPESGSPPLSPRWRNPFQVHHTSTRPIPQRLDSGVGVRTESEMVMAMAMGMEREVCECPPISSRSNSSDTSTASSAQTFWSAHSSWSARSDRSGVSAHSARSYRSARDIRRTDSAISLMPQAEMYESEPLSPHSSFSRSRRSPDWSSPTSSSGGVPANPTPSDEDQPKQEESIYHLPSDLLLSPPLPFIGSGDPVPETPWDGPYTPLELELELEQAPAAVPASASSLVWTGRDWTPGFGIGHEERVGFGYDVNWQAMAEWDVGVGSPLASSTAVISPFEMMQGVGGATLLVPAERLWADSQELNRRTRALSLAVLDNRDIAMYDVSIDATQHHEQQPEHEKAAAPASTSPSPTAQKTPAGPPNISARRG